MNDSLPNSVQDMTDILDIEGLIHTDLPHVIMVVLYAILAILAVVAFFFIVKKIVNKFKSKSQFHLLPADEQALIELERLKKKEWIETKKWQEFYFALDEIFRRYLYRAFQYDVMDKTFEELKAKMNQFSKLCTQNDVSEMEKFWSRSQLIKFAKQDSATQEAELDFHFVKEFIVSTRMNMEKDERKLMSSKVSS